jgi:LPXTG-site transpeptidase (sortase) family protein
VRCGMHPSKSWNERGPRRGGAVGHRTEHNRIGLALRGLCSIVVASMGTLLLWGPGAASEPRPQGFLAVAQRTLKVPLSHDTAPAQVTLSNVKGLWAKPKGTNVPVGRLRIPAIGLDTPFRLGIHDDVVELGPGLWPGTPLPGDVGNAVFAGHRTTYTHPFGDIDFLHKGNVITTQIQGRGRTFFRVIKTTVVPEFDYADFVLRQPQRRRARMVTLFACTPKGFRTHRIVVQARASRIRREVQGRQTRHLDPSRLHERS